MRERDLKVIFHEVGPHVRNPPKFAKNLEAPILCSKGQHMIFFPIGSNTMKFIYFSFVPKGA
jgi:hypothetical protein